MRALALGVALLAAAAQAGAQEATVSPASPRAGTIFRVVVDAGSDGAAPTGSLSGEPLHFEKVGRARYAALAAVPVDASDSATLEYQVGAGGSRTLSIPIAPGDYPSEKLTVAPTYGTKPSAATQARIDAEGKRAAAVARASHDTPRMWEGAFVTPRPGRVTSGFGRARVFNGEVASRHMGTDFAGAVGAPVKAANRGVVRIVDRFFLGGNVIYIDHGGGVVTAYLHLSKQGVAVGDTVEKGQVIGRVGATGRVTGPHLHLIARYGGVTVDPMSLLAVTRGG